MILYLVPFIVIDLDLFFSFTNVSADRAGKSVAVESKHGNETIAWRKKRDVGAL